VIYTPFVEASKIISAQSQAYSAPVMPITYVGYDGSAGEIDTLDDTVYKIRILIHSVLSQFGNKAMYKFGVYKSGSAATQEDIAFGIVTNLTANFAKETLVTLKFATINSCALASGYALDDGHISVVKGSNVLTAATSDFQYNTGTEVVVGDFIRISDAAAVGTAVALTDPVYKVTYVNAAVNVTIVHVDRAVTNVTGTYTHTSGDLTIIPAASIGGEWGIKITGVAMTWFKAGVFKYEVPDFEVFLQDFGATTTTVAYAASRGSGVAEEIQELQWFLQGNLGNKYHADPLATFKTDAVIGVAYNLVTIRYYTEGGDIVGDPIRHPKEIILALFDSGSFDNVLVDILQTDTTHYTFADFEDR
jgi:hypothetical protein